MPRQPGTAVLATVSAHPRLHGPFGAAGGVLAAVVPQVVRLNPDLVIAHEVEILAVAPELVGLWRRQRQTLAEAAVGDLRTRFYSTNYPLRLAHGITEFLIAYLTTQHSGSVIVVTDADHADSYDREWFSIVARRSDPGLLALEFQPATGQHDAPSGSDVTNLAASYVASDCTATDPRLRNAYDSLSDEQRRDLHDARADALVAAGNPAHIRELIPFHTERGATPTRAVDALQAAAEECARHGFYTNTVDLATRGMALLEPAADDERWATLAGQKSYALMQLGECHAALALHNEVRAHSTDPVVQLRTAYGTSMLYARLFPPAERDLTQARGWTNVGLAFAAALPVSDQQAFRLASMYNAAALMEVRSGNSEAALRKVAQAESTLREVYPPGEPAQLLSELEFNRAQVHVSTGNLDAALRSITAVIEADPHFADYLVFRAEILMSLGRDGEAMADYDAAVLLGPPLAEATYNRAQAHLANDDLESAVADFSYVLELEPSSVDALTNRASAFVDLGQLTQARADVEAGLAIDPQDLHLRCLKGQVLTLQRDIPSAVNTLSTVIEDDPDFVPAIAARGVAHFEGGSFSAAVADFDRALELDDDPDIRSNRELALSQLST